MKRCLTMLACSLLILGQPVAGQADPAEPAAQARQEAKKQAAEQLAKIELPDNPTREQCEAYIKEIRQQTGFARGLAETDPQVTQLSKLPVEHIELLVRERRSNNSRMAFYAIMAIRTYEPESYRQLAIDGLLEEPDFIYLIARHGWYEDAKKQIIARLKVIDTGDAKFKPIWFQAFIEVAEPEHHPLIHEIILSFYDVGKRLDLLETMPDYDFAFTVNACWKNAKKLNADGSEKTAVVLGFMSNPSVKVTKTLRPFAIRAGNIDALAEVIDDLNSPRSERVEKANWNSPKDLNDARLTVRRYLDFNGTNEEIQAWFKANRDDIVFDTFRQRYTLQEPF